MVKALLPMWDLIKLHADEFSLDPALVGAIIMQESNATKWSYRYEPNVKWSYMPQSYATKLRITFDTELCMQHTSWGLMHIMGFKARELGFDDHLPELLGPDLAIKWGCRALSSFKCETLEDTIASYNAGSVRKVDGVYENQGYVDGVKFWMSEIRRVE